jgi:hypothetical protein
MEDYTRLHKNASKMNKMMPPGKIPPHRQLAIGCLDSETMQAYKHWRNTVSCANAVLRDTTLATQPLNARWANDIIELDQVLSSRSVVCPGSQSE